MKPSSQISEKLLLKSITTALARYINETDPYILFNGLLETLLEITQSEYGFIGEIFHNDAGEPYLKSYATTDISWSTQTHQLYEANKRKGMLFSRLDSLYGSVLKTGQMIIANKPLNDPRACGLPKGHPPLNSFLGLPFYGGGKLLGMVGIANKQNGYESSMADSLKPFLSACGSLIEAYQNNIKHQHIAQQLNEYQHRLMTLNKATNMGHGYEFSFSPPTLKRHGHPVLLTRKELSLLELLVHNKDTPVRHEAIWEHVWKDVIVGEASIRSLVRRLRQKMPELSIKTVSGIGYLLTSDLS